MTLRRRGGCSPDVVVVASGAGPSVAVPGAPTVVAADGGLDRAIALGLDVDVVIGDLDSVSAGALAAAEAAGARVVRHPEAKDATDLELALDEAVRIGARRVLVVASAEGRLDHLLGSLLLLGAERYAEIELDAIVGDALVHVVRGERALSGSPGELVSLLCDRRAGHRRRHEGTRVPARRRDAGSGVEQGRLERLHRHRGARHGRRRSAARDPPGRREAVTPGEAACNVSSASGGSPRSILVAAAVVAVAGCGGDRGRADRGRAPHARLVRDLEGGQGRVRGGERADAADPPGRGRERDAQPRAPDRRRPAGRRDLRDRRLRPLARARRRPARGVPLGRARGRRPGVRGRRTTT